MNSTDNNQLEELRAYNQAIEDSPEYQSILPEVMKEVYTIFVNERIEDLERTLDKEDIEADNDVFSSLYKELRKSTEEKLKEAKSLMPDNPERAANVLEQLGCCHRLWSLQKRILKEKYGITWYTPAELNPDTKFD